MPIEIYKRGEFWWVRGRVDLHGVPITGYYRRSTGASEEAGARDWIYTELTVRQGIDPVTAAKAGRWSDVTLPLRAYGHAEADEGAIRELVRTGPVHDEAAQKIKRLKANE